MNTDRELLELAAKAVGLDTNHSWNASRLEMDPPVIAMVVYDAGNKLVSTGWNPLENDGDALRLAVKLRLDIQFFDGHEQVMCEQGTGDDERQSWEDYAEDVGKATRRAIIRAAAEIGRSMP
ncbi:hypothetical protein D9M68_651020 [compost metagenome]